MCNSDTVNNPQRTKVRIKLRRATDLRIACLFQESVSEDTQNMTIRMAVRNSFSQPPETPNDHTTRQNLWGRECGDTLTKSLPCVRMSHTAWSVKLSSTLVYGATSRWNSD